MRDQLTRPNLSFWYVCGRALLRPACMLALGFSLVALCVSPVAAVCGVVAALFILGLSLSRPSTWRRAARERDQRWNALPPSWAITDARVRGAVTAIEDGMREVKHLLPTLPPRVQAQLRHLGTSLDGARACAAELVRRATWLGDFARTDRREGLQREFDKLCETAADAPEGAKGAFDAAIQARLQQLTALAEIDAERERALADLLRVAAVVGALPHRIAALCVAHADYLNGTSRSVDDVLVALESEVRAPQLLIQRALAEARPPD